MRACQNNMACTFKVCDIEYGLASYKIYYNHFEFIGSGKNINIQVCAVLQTPTSPGNWQKEEGRSGERGDAKLPDALRIPMNGSPFGRGWWCLPIK